MEQDGGTMTDLQYSGQAAIYIYLPSTMLMTSKDSRERNDSIFDYGIIIPKFHQVTPLLETTTGFGICGPNFLSESK